MSSGVGRDRWYTRRSPRSAPRSSTVDQRMATPPLLTILLPVRNAARELPDFLASASRYADAVVALDDGSTDDTHAILAAHPLVKVLLTNPVRTTYAGWNDAENRNATLAGAARLDPIWILSLDADERIDEADGLALRAFLENDALPGLAFGFERFEMRGDHGLHLPEGVWQYRLFAHEPGQRFPSKRLHFAPIPLSIPRSAHVNTTFRIQHLGGSTPERRLAQYEKYRLTDPDCLYWPDYTAVLDDDPIRPPVPWAMRPADLPPFAAAGPSGPLVAETLSVVASYDHPILSDGAKGIEWIASSASSPLLDRRLVEQLTGSVVLALPRDLRPRHGAIVELLTGHAAGYALVAPLINAPTADTVAGRVVHRRYAPPVLLPEGSVLDRPPVYCSYRRSLLLDVLAGPSPPTSTSALNQRLHRDGYLCVQSGAELDVVDAEGRSTVAAAGEALNVGRDRAADALERHRLAGRLLRPPRRQGPRDIAVRPIVSAADPLPDSVLARMGLVAELVRPSPGKLSVLLGAPQLVALWDLTSGGRRRLALVSWSQAKGSVRWLEVPATLEVQRADGAWATLGDALEPRRLPRRFELHELIGRGLSVAVDDSVRMDVSNRDVELRGYARTIALPTLRSIASVETSFDRLSLGLFLAASLRARHEELRPWPRGSDVRRLDPATASTIGRFFAGHTQRDLGTMRDRVRVATVGGDSRPDR